MTEQNKAPIHRKSAILSAPNLLIRLPELQAEISRIVNVTMNNPDVVAGLALLQILNDACDDPRIKASPKILYHIEVIRDRLSNASIGADDEEIHAPLISEIAKQSISNDRRNAAASKNSAPRKWVLKEWEIRSDKGQSKASFARQHAPFVKNKFKLNVTPETISRDWLPKAKK